jgi:hypothetical protein
LIALWRKLGARSVAVHFEWTDVFYDFHSQYFYVDEYKGTSDFPKSSQVGVAYMCADLCPFGCSCNLKPCMKCDIGTPIYIDPISSRPCNVTTNTHCIIGYCDSGLAEITLADDVILDYESNKGEVITRII